jgi:topoisomerase IA-like protein
MAALTIDLAGAIKLLPLPRHPGRSPYCEATLVVEAAADRPGGLPMPP